LIELTNALNADDETETTRENETSSIKE